MKKTILVTTVILSATLFATVAPAALADEQKTKGDISFLTNTENPSEIIVKGPNVEFGQKKISGSTEIYGSQLISSGIRVVDNRGTNAGWNVTVKNDPFKTDPNASNSELTGAVLTLTTGTVKNDNNPKSSDLYSSVAEKTIVLKGDSKEVQAVGSEKNKGMGINSVSVVSATLEVPGTSEKLKETYDSTLTWTLSDSPL